ncbi:MAG: hypothetical protein A2Z88_06045 [Omnitrophica WOR_2 bacterium GWA2_47_8]|nr:MAG: hypothetical protein A2Z88_06045 [Omnitrophica WOR_2 bacterium GWA2_47_8]
METLGLIAGNGKFPILFAKAAKAKKIRVIAAGVKGDTSWLLKPFVDKISVFHVGELQKLFNFFKQEGVKDVIMAGQVNPKNLFDDRVTLDKEFQELYTALQDRKADTIFSAVANKLKENNMELLDSTLLLRDYMAPRGTLTKRGPTLIELADIEFGKNIAKAMGSLDVGQTVVVKEKAIVAIEAMEGTDQAILRGGGIAQKGAVVVKVSKPQQDFRFDVPVVGPKTIQTMQKARCSCLAVEAGKTLIIDRDSFINLANKADICIVAA